MSYLLGRCRTSAGETLGSDCEVILQVKKKRKSKVGRHEKQRTAADAALSKGHRGARMKCLDFCCQNTPNVTASNHLASKAYEPINLKVQFGGGFCIFMCYIVNSWGRMGHFSCRRLNKHTAVLRFDVELVGPVV